MKRLTVLSLVLSAILGSQAIAGTQKIAGAGATFPYPVYSQWAYKYKGLTGVEVSYQSIGSGGGIAQIKAKTVDFGASDAPLEPAELDEFGLVQFPMVIGGVVPVVNIEGVKPGELKLTGDVLTSIYLGEIVKWNDKRITEINTGLKLPDLAITVVHRADGSGTTWIFTNYLMKVSPAWNKKVGFGKAVEWPVGIGGKGNEGVAAYVERVEGSIGYVEFAYAVQNKMSHTALKNQAGKFVSPTIETFQAAAASADWKKSKGYYLVLTDQPGDQSWPITGASFILIHKDQKDTTLAKAMLEYFHWCYRHGGELATELDYVPMPENVVDMVEGTWQDELTSSGAPVWSITVNANK